MADRRTLEELKILLQASHAAEDKLISKKGSQSSRAQFKGDTATQIKINRLLERLSGKEPVEVQDFLGNPTQVMKSTPRGYRQNPFERRRRKLLADYIRQIREEFPDPKQARAHIFDALRADIEIGKKKAFGATLSRKNPLVPLLGKMEELPGEVYDDFATSAMEDRLYGGYRDTEDMIDEFGNRLEREPPDVVDDTNEQMTREVRKREGEMVQSTRKKGGFSRRNLRRTPQSDLLALLGISIGNVDPRAGLDITEELNRRVLDEVNRGRSRREILSKVAGSMVKPSLPTAGPGGSGGEKVARTLLRLMRRGR